MVFFIIKNWKKWDVNFFGFFRGKNVPKSTNTHCLGIKNFLTYSRSVKARSIITVLTYSVKQLSKAITTTFGANIQAN